MTERWSRTSYGARVAHLERATRVLDCADALLARAATHPQNRVLFDEMKQFFIDLRTAGLSLVQPMSAQPFIETIDPVVQ